MGSGFRRRTFSLEAQAGSDQVIALPDSAVLDGSVSDDGLPTPSVLSTLWSQVSGPGPIAFADATVVDTIANFSIAGNYVLRLTAADGKLQSIDEVAVVVNPAAGTTVLDVRVASGTDDAEERTSGGVGLTSSDLELVSDGNEQTVGIRFTGITIPQGATISYASIQFQVDESSSAATSLTLQGEAVDNSVTFSTANGNISSRSRTSAAIPWTPPAWNTVGEAGADQRTPNIASAIQEIVNRGGWLSGNALAIIVTGSGSRVAESFNGSSAAAALLHIEYQE